MDNNEKQKLQTTSQFNKYRLLLKKNLKFVISISLLLFLVPSSSSIYHFFHSFNFHFSQLLFPLLGQTLERKYAFLICNGIVVVLAKNFSFTDSSPPGSGLTGDFGKTNEDGVKSVSEIEAQLKDKEVTIESVTESLENVSALEEEENGILNIQVPERESPSVITGAEDDEEDEEAKLEESRYLIPQSSAEDEGNEVNVSTEELNRKFDEFIRKMKEEIRIGAQQKLIAV